MHKYQIYSNNLDIHTFRLLTITTTEAKEKVNQGRVPKQSEMLLLPTYTNLDFSSHTRDVSWRVAPFTNNHGKPAKRPSGKTGAAQVTAWRYWKPQPPIAIRQCIPFLIFLSSAVSIVSHLNQALLFLPMHFASFLAVSMILFFWHVFPGW